MTLPHDSARPVVGQRAGFTLLEVVIAMGIIAMIFTVGFLSVGSGQIERELRAESAVIEDAFRKARNLALVQQRPYVVTLRPDSLSLGPRGSAEVVGRTARRTLTSSRRRSLSNRAEEQAAEDAKQWADVEEYKEFEEGLEISVQRWGAQKPVELKRKTDVQSFIIEPTGLVEPAVIRVARENSWLEYELSPLSGAARNESMEIRK